MAMITKSHMDERYIFNYESGKIFVKNLKKVIDKLRRKR